MGTNLRPLLKVRNIHWDELKGKAIVIDAHNALYQFLATIRQPDGSYLTDSTGRVTSHLIGLFYRTTKLIEFGIKAAFVFDGPAPKIKKKELMRRTEAKELAITEYKKARLAGDISAMRKWAARSIFLSPKMVVEAKRLVDALGLPVVEAPSEAEAEAAHLVKQGTAFAVASEDYDCLLHGAPRLLRKLSAPSRSNIPEIVFLKESLAVIGIDQKQLIALALLIGTDYNPGGIKGLGPKKAVKLVKKFKGDFDRMFKYVGWDFDVSWQDIMEQIINMPTKDVELRWKGIDKERVIKLLVDEHNFSEEKVSSALRRAERGFKFVFEGKKQRALSEF